ncbi:MAG: hypothetical protein JXX29_11055 [Deltaproteobacteria bacterium]|nr:hypothetical protein [Deltaproteobacteria bacterium]
MRRNILIVIAGWILLGVGACDDGLVVAAASTGGTYPDCDNYSTTEILGAIDLDLSTAAPPNVVFRIGNDYSNRNVLVTECSIDTGIPGMGVLGETAFFPLHQTISEGEDAWVKTPIMTETAWEVLQEHLGCPAITSVDVDEFGNALMTDTLSDDNIVFYSAHLNPQGRGLEVNVTVQFFGTDSRDNSIQSNDFTLDVNLYCGPEGGWAPCIDDSCAGLCGDSNLMPVCENGIHPPRSCVDILSAREWTHPTNNAPYCDHFCL